jgi:hypothetical protein
MNQLVESTWPGYVARLQLRVTRVRLAVRPRRGSRNGGKDKSTRPKTGSRAITPRVRGVVLLFGGGTRRNWTNFFSLIINTQSYLLSFDLISVFYKVKNIKLVVNDYNNYTIKNFTPGDESPYSTPASVAPRTRTRNTRGKNIDANTWNHRRARFYRK